MATLDRTCKTLDSEQLSVSIEQMLRNIEIFDPVEQSELLDLLNQNFLAIKKRRAETELARQWLRKCFPALFEEQPKLIAKQGYWEIKDTWRNLPETAKSHLPYKAIKRVLKEVTHTSEYHRLLMTVGTPRHTTNGDIVCHVTHENVEALYA